MKRPIPNIATCWARPVGAAAVALLLTASCSAPGGDTPARPERSTAITTSSSSAEPTEEPGDRLDSSAVLSQQQVMDRYRASLAEDAKSLGLTEIPDVPLIRFIAPTELGQTMVSCLAEKGMPATSVNGGAGYQLGDVPDSQARAASLAQYECSASYPIHPQYTLPKSSAARAKEYDWMVGTRIPCYRAQGYAISEPPSKEVWIASFTTGDVWGPDLDVERVIGRDKAAWQILNEKCPSPSPYQFIEHPPQLDR